MIIAPQQKKRGGDYKKVFSIHKKECKNQVAAERLGKNWNGQGVKRRAAGFFYCMADRKKKKAKKGMVNRRVACGWTGHRVLVQIQRARKSDIIISVVK